MVFVVASLHICEHIFCAESEEGEGIVGEGEALTSTYPCILILTVKLLS